jgi:hypothetical protein
MATTLCEPSGQSGVARISIDVLHVNHSYLSDNSKGIAYAFQRACDILELASMEGEFDFHFCAVFVSGLNRMLSKENHFLF